MYNTFFSLGVSVQHTEKLWQNVIGAGRWSHILNATTYCEAYCKEFFQQHKLNTKKMHITLQTTCSCSFQWLDFSLLLTLAKANHSYCIHNILSSHPISLHLILSLSCTAVTFPLLKYFVRIHPRSIYISPYGLYKW